MHDLKLCSIHAANFLTDVFHFTFFTSIENRTLNCNTGWNCESGVKINLFVLKSFKL